MMLCFTYYFVLTLSQVHKNTNRDISIVNSLRHPLVAIELLNPPPHNLPVENSKPSNVAAKSEATKKRKTSVIQQGGKSKKNATKEDVNFISDSSDDGETIIGDDDAATVKVQEVTVLTEVCTIDLTGDDDVDDIKVTTSFRASQSG